MPNIAFFFVLGSKLSRGCVSYFTNHKSKNTPKNRQPRRLNDNTRLLVNWRKTYVLNCSSQSPFGLKFRRTNQISKQICAADKKRGKTHVRISWLVLVLLLIGYKMVRGFFFSQPITAWQPKAQANTKLV